MRDVKGKKPILALAPMEDVTDTAFRRIVARLAKPDVFYTEFTSVDGLFSRGRDAVIHRLDYTEEERPIVAQVWGSDPALFYKATGLIRDLKFDGVDINMGCPQKSIIQHKAGAACINDPIRAAEIIAATREGARGLPVSVKTRIGYKTISKTWIPFLLEQHLDSLTIHGRTAAELSKVPAHWDEIAKATNHGTVIIGNGDVVDYADAVQKCGKYGTDGAMIGRGIFHNLWAFSKTGVNHMDDQQEMFRLLQLHMQLFEKVYLPAGRPFAVMKKFFKIYVQGFSHASDLRERLMACEDRRAVEDILSKFGGRQEG